MELGKTKYLIEKIAKDNSISTQSAWDLLFFEEIIYRISLSEYNKCFVFKGGFYFQSIVGIKNRSTMDLDFKYVGKELSNKELNKIFEEILLLNSQSNISYKIVKIIDIVSETIYGGKTIKLEASFFNIRKIFKIDIGFKDVVTPYPLDYNYSSLFHSSKFNILAYPVETIIAEKFETLISKGKNNSRAKDLYDLFILSKLNINLSILNTAIINTFYLRKTIYDRKYIKEQLDEIFSFDRLNELYNNYAKKNCFVNNITFKMCKESVYNIFSQLTFKEKIDLNKYNIKLHLIRHGEDENDKVGGWSSNHLSSKGIEEIYSLINYIDNDYDLFISSDLTRAKESSEIINSKLKMEVKYNTKLRETNNGALKDLTFEQFNKQFNGLYYSKLNMNEKYPGGESPNDFFYRVTNEFYKIIENNQNKKILIVTHGGVITIILSLLYGFPYNNNLKIAPKTGEIIRID